MSEEDKLNTLQNDLISELITYINLLNEFESEENEIDLYENMLLNERYLDVMKKKVEAENKKLKEKREKKPKK